MLVQLAEYRKEWRYGGDYLLPAVTEAIAWMNKKKSKDSCCLWRMVIHHDNVLMIGRKDGSRYSPCGIFVNCSIRPSVLKCILMMTMHVPILRDVVVNDGFSQLCILAGDDDISALQIVVEDEQMKLTRGDGNGFRYNTVSGPCEKLLAIEDIGSIPTGWRIRTGFIDRPISNVDDVRQLLIRVGVSVPVEVITFMSTVSIDEWEGVKELRWYPKVKLVTAPDFEESDPPEVALLQAHTLEYEERLHGWRTMVVLTLLGHVHCPRLYGASTIRALPVDLLRLIVSSL
jgi:hypothetical protein